MQTLPQTSVVNPMLKFVMGADALLSGGLGVLMALAAGPLAGLLGLPSALLFYAGIVLVLYAGLVGWCAKRSALSRGMILTLIAINLVWAMDCIALLLSGFVQPNALGIAFLVAQALFTVVIAELLIIGMRRERVAQVA